MAMARITVGEDKHMAKYNGWTNFETWAVALWIGNDEASYKYWRACAEASVRDSIDFEQAQIMLSQMLHDEIEDSMPDLGATLWADLLGSAVCEVNWHEIAGDMLEDFKPSARAVPS